MKTLPAPPPTRVEEVVDVLHGHRITDPYRWLEDADNPDTAAWVEAQNAYTRSLLDAVPARGRIRDRLEQLLAIGTVSAPVIRGGRYFYQRREGHQNQPVLYVREGVDEEDRVLLDPNAESEQGLVVLDWWYPSWDGRLLCCGLSRDGSEWSTLSVLDVDTGHRLSDRVERTRYASVAWLPDGSGLYYTRYPLPCEVPEGEENYHVRVAFHALGSGREEDEVLFGENLAMEDIPRVSISPDGRWLWVEVFRGWERSDLYLRDLAATDADFVPVVIGYDALFSAQVVEDALYIHTNLEASRYRLFRVDAADPRRERWEEIISESPDAVLESVTPAGGHLVCSFMRNATSSLAVHAADGKKLRDIALPTLGTVTAVSGRWSLPDAFFSFESFTVPPTVFRLPVEDGEPRVWTAVEADIRSEDYSIAQEWYTSKDGTRVSMFVVHRAGLDRTSPQPTVLTGYGGFNVPKTPLFDRSVHLWLEAGGIYALPNLRGGSEYGEDWHRAGMLDRKQNVFDDFITAAEYLIERGYTDTSRLAIYGRSNGGLLVGAALTQRPELCRAVVCGVPLLDMLRYHNFLIARLWIAEYGSADNPEQFPFLYAYSPYHHVRSGEEYPAVLLTTAESDTRVDPLHARKMTALLQAASASDHPVLLRVESHAGHGIGKPLTKVIDEWTDIWSFVFWQLGINQLNMP